ncbi:hypothetical protein V492_06154 [Pseudogymnoascus sp. VKM F-4246]|nr:hypothetical protein V492_06154 [Pseudogymnoascus sp. VKM F-4246]
MSFLAVLQWVIIALVGYLIYQYSSGRPGRRNLPPGPKPLPIVGNARNFPPAGVPEFQHWLKHKDMYGPISSVTVLGTTLVVIHDKKAAHDLLEQESIKTSGRPTMVFANKLCGYETIMICQGYTDTFRHHRKLLHQELGTKVSAAQFRGVQELEVNRQLIRALNEPEKFLEHFKTTSAATILKMTYGYTIDPHKPDALVDLIEKMMTEFSLAAVPMAWPVDLIPLLRHIPENFPGVKFKKIARKWKKSIRATAYTPYRFTQRQIAAHGHQQSYVSKLIRKFAPDDESASLNGEDEEAIVWTAASLYGAAADTTMMSLSVFTLAMVMFPHVQRKAQDEIDRVIGTDRLPNFGDRDKLPYISAIVREILRWWPIAPMGFPHAVDSDIEYNGLHIPKGALLLPAVWWFLHDPDVYANPGSFDPERFLSPRNEPDPDTEAFGYGRRICPGRFFADSSLYINIVQTLATFNIAKLIDEDGNEIAVDAKPKPGILSYPPEFQFKVEPRSQKHVDLIRRVELEHPLEEGDAGLLGSETD